MLLKENELSLKEFYRLYGGQRRHSICTPRNKPYIYLFTSLNKNDGFGIIDDVIEGKETKPEYVRFAFEGEGDLTNGNLAVLDHNNPDSGVYKSLLLFLVSGGMISEIGEYERVDLDESIPPIFIRDVSFEEENHRYGITYDGKKFFLLKRVDDLDEVVVKLVVPGEEEKDYIYAEELGNRSDYNFLSDDRIETGLEKLSKEFNLYDFLDKDNNGVDLGGRRIIKKKTNQYLSMVCGIHNELKRNNDDVGRNYEPSLSPTIRYDKAYFYVVNVGWGLFQMLVFKSSEDNTTEAWVFDCGRQNATYNNNIDDCFLDAFGTYNKPHISKLFISHPHDDHFSAWSLFDIDSDTEVWVNPNVRFCTNTYYTFLKKVCTSNCIVVEAITKVNSGIAGDVIEVLHPDGHIVLDKKGKKAIYKSPIISFVPVTGKTAYKVDENRMNELSPIIKLNVLGKEIVVVGDVMGQGWKSYINNLSIGAQKIILDVYVHSHHGTTSGFQISYNGVDTEYDLFTPRNGFVSLNDTFRGWSIDSRLKSLLYRTDASSTVKFIKYDIVNDVVCLVT